MRSAMHPDINVVASTDYQDSFPETQVLPIGTDGTSVPGEAYHPFGFIGRCNDADVDPSTGDVTNGARVLFFYEGSTLHTIMLDDPRVTPTLPQLPKGGSMQYDAGGAYQKLDGSGNALLNVPSGSTVSLGDDTAQPFVTKADYDKLIQALATFAAGNCVNGAPLSTSVNFVAAITAPLGSAVPKYTTKAKAT